MAKTKKEETPSSFDRFKGCSISEEITPGKQTVICVETENGLELIDFRSIPDAILKTIKGLDLE